MAVIRPGGAVGAISGNLGSCNFAQGKYGAYVRRRLTRTDKKTERQLLYRQKIRKMLRGWYEMTDEEKRTWRKAAEGARFINRLGMSRPLSGSQLYAVINKPFMEDFLYQPVEPPVMTPSPSVYSMNLAVTLPNTYTVSWLPVVAPGTRVATFFAARTLKNRRVRPIKHWRLILISWATGPNLNIQVQFDANWGKPIAGEYVEVAMRVWEPKLLPSVIQTAGCIVV